MEKVSGYASKVRRAFQTKDSVSYGATSERASSDQETSRLLVELHPSHADNNNDNDINERTHDSEISGMVLAGTYIRKHITSLIIVILTLIIFALAGENASSKGEAAQLVETKLTSTEIKWRPCQVYLDPTINPVKIIQTSLSDPASQWASMPCLVRSTKMEKETSYSKALQESQWSWLFGITQDESQNPLEYGMPSAQIHVDFDTVPYQNSQPIHGFGGAFTEASALNYMSLHNDGKKAVIDLLKFCVFYKERMQKSKTKQKTEAACHCFLTHE